MPVFSSKMTLFGKAGLYTINGMVSPFQRDTAELCKEWLLFLVSLDHYFPRDAQRDCITEQ